MLLGVSHCDVIIRVKYSVFIVSEFLLHEHYVELLLKSSILLICLFFGVVFRVFFACFRKYSNLSENCVED